MRGLVAVLGRQFSFYLGIVLFLAFSAIARYWRFWLPGGRYASPLPAHLVPAERDPRVLAEWARDARLYRRLARPSIRRDLEHSDKEKLIEFDHALSLLRAALESGDRELARTARVRLAPTARKALARADVYETLALAAGVAAFAAFGWLFRAKVAEPYQVLSASMVPTLEPGDLVVGTRVTYARASVHEPHRGDLIVFRSAAVPLGRAALTGLPPVLVKRVIGLPGDLIAMRGPAPTINGWQVPSCEVGDYVYVLPDASGRTLQGRLLVEYLDDRVFLTVHVGQLTATREPYRVKPGEVFVLGDNRSNSLDSRAYNQGRGGGVSLEAIEAQAQWFLWRTDRSGDTDVRRFLRPIDGLQVRLELGSVQQIGLLDEKLARCLRDRPKDTRPPAPSSEPSASRDSGAVP